MKKLKRVIQKVAGLPWASAKHGISNCLIGGGSGVERGEGGEAAVGM